jgi:hypothetical protein
MLAAIHSDRDHIWQLPDVHEPSTRAPLTGGLARFRRAERSEPRGHGPGALKGYLYPTLKKIIRDGISDVISHGI